MRVLVCGSRNWVEDGTMYEVLSQFPSGTVIIHGGCKGADEDAGDIARQLGFKVEVYNADWAKYGRAAGPIRNQAMLDSKPDVVLAFHENISSSKGTRDTLRRASMLNIPSKIYG